MADSQTLQELEDCSPPRHIAIIMDGNGRWAQLQGKPRHQGHQEGVARTKDIVRACALKGIEVLSLFVFSTENWKRTEEEVGFLMDLLVRYLRKEYEFYRELGIRIVHSGNLQGLPAKVRSELIEACNDTKGHLGMTVNLAINYGGRDEVVRACRAWAQDGCPVPDDLTEELLDTYMDNPELPDVDLLIRSGGEKRISNFLLWKTNYAELYFSDVLWPDWDAHELDNALAEYQQRKRRFGGL